MVRGDGLLSARVGRMRQLPGVVALLLAACGGEGPAQSQATATSGPATPDTTAPAATDGAPTSSASTGAATTAEAASTGTSTASAGGSTSGSSGGATPEASTAEALRPDLPPPCVPTTCVDEGKTCGGIPDGCGGELACGECEAPDGCGGGGVDNVCGHPCVPVRMLFFDLGDTLVELDGDLYVERPGVNATIGELKGLGMRVGVITNTPDGFTLQDLQDLLVNPGFLDEFELVLLSSLAASPPKPDPAIFAEAHGMVVDAPPIAEVAHVSEDLAEIADLEVAPTQGARAAGMLGIHLSSAPPSPRANYTVAPDMLDTLVAMAETEWLACEGSP